MGGGGGEDNIIMLECQTCIRYVIVLAILHILIGIGLTNKLQIVRIASILVARRDNFGGGYSRLGGKSQVFTTSVSIPEQGDTGA